MPSLMLPSYYVSTSFSLFFILRAFTQFILYNLIDMNAVHMEKYSQTSSTNIKKTNKRIANNIISIIRRENIKK
ncbi:hypothetical protein RhiirC2_295444 [Rhizophagus irregularis]|uniref:Uncharacterized protein n=1 Tax=Rhizophagus irregularis TaxID=588596 RepID=A0A2N1NKK4_9GLOM|nr:hypothetical protein RhiirC2_295444 [Rhizophagus irregularis]